MNEQLHSKDFPDSFHRVSVKGLCVRDGKLLLVREGVSRGGRWALPGGGLNFGEDVREGLKREIQEEMRVPISKISKSPLYTWTTRHTKAFGHDWFYSFLVAYQVAFEHLNVALNEECAEIGFFSKEEMATLSVNTQLKKFIDLFDPAKFDPNF